jgi:hypothetical protein
MMTDYDDAEPVVTGDSDALNPFSRFRNYFSARICGTEITEQILIARKN